MKSFNELKDNDEIYLAYGLNDNDFNSIDVDFDTTIGIKTLHFDSLELENKKDEFLVGKIKGLIWVLKAKENHPYFNRPYQFSFRDWDLSGHNNEKEVKARERGEKYLITTDYSEAVAHCRKAKNFILEKIEEEKEHLRKIENYLNNEKDF